MSRGEKLAGANAERVVLHLKLFSLVQAWVSLAASRDAGRHTFTGNSRWMDGKRKE